MHKLKRDSCFDAGTYKWRFECWLDELPSGDPAKYFVRLYRWIPANESQLELVWEITFGSALSHAFIENDELYKALVESQKKLIIDNASKIG